MSYEHIRIDGNLAERLEALVVREHGDLVDLEVGGISEGEFAAVGYAAVANGDSVTAVVLLVQHDPKAGADHYRVRDITESEGPVVDFCPERILDLLTPTQDHLAIHWRERCRERIGEEAARPAFSLNS